LRAGSRLNAGQAQAARTVPNRAVGGGKLASAQLSPR